MQEAEKQPEGEQSFEDFVLELARIDAEKAQKKYEIIKDRVDKLKT